MATIKSLDELKALRDKYKGNVDMRSNLGDENKIRIAVGMATCGIASGSRETINAIVEEVKALGLTNVSVVQTGCLGYCYAEPVVEVSMPGKEPLLYGSINASKAKEIVHKHLKKGEAIGDWVIERSRC
ncbi:MAG: NADP oxidoreductase [Clostridiales bacterium GWB2_37_7]|nr:MAG: NADP oxidoreductase [Clostridiales bacterium GWB2_37_7]